MRPRRAQNGVDARRHKPDYVLLVVSSILLAVGVVLMVAISPALTTQNNLAGSYYVMRQCIAVLIGLVFFFIVSRLNVHSLRKLQIPLIGASVVAASLVLILSGVAFRWIQIGGLSFQPAELIKFTIVIVGALFLADRVADGTYTDTRKTLVPIAIAMGIVAFIILILERDLGSMVVMAAIICVMLLVANVPFQKLLLVLGVLALLGGVAVMSTQYRRDRFATFLNPTSDCTEAGYHACQALIAVGSGGLMGLGLGNSVQAYGYLPEASNDSIFAIYAEKFGFVGSLLLTCLYGVLFFRILTIVRRAPDMPSRLLAAGVFGWLVFQTVINIGAMIGLLPLKGITLPFISYGGSSIIFVMGALGLVFRISSQTVVRRSLSSGEGRSNDEAADYPAQRRGNSRPYYANTPRRPGTEAF